MVEKILYRCNLAPIQWKDTLRVRRSHNILVQPIKIPLLAVCQFLAFFKSYLACVVNCINYIMRVIPVLASKRSVTNKYAIKNYSYSLVHPSSGSQLNAHFINLI